MNCPNCGAFTYEDNLGRWFCSAQCGWNSGFTMGEINGMSELWSTDAAGPGRRVAVRKLRLAVRGCARADGGTFGA